MKAMAERIAALTPQQRLLLERIRGKQQETQDASDIPIRPQTGPWPACADQAALWFFQRLDANAVPYNIGNAQRMFGPVDHDLLEQAYAQLVQRQEMLRAHYPVVDGVPHVDIAPDPHMPVIHVDLRRVPEAEREAAAQKQAARHINHPFDMENGPIMRFVVIQLAEEEHIFIPVMHHSITDAISYNIFFRELIVLYLGLQKGKPAQLPKLTRQYVDYGLWRNQWLESNAFTQELDWWCNHLNGAPSLADVPGDHARPETPTYRGGRAFFTLDKETTHAMRALNRRAGTTSLMTLLAGAFALFYRYAGMRDMLIAVPASHREHREMTHVIGYFLNYIPFRGQVRPGMNFTQLLAETKANVLGGLAHKRVPFSAIVDAVNPIRDPRYMPLAQLGFVYVSAAGLNNQSAKLHEEEGEGSPFRVEGYYADREISPMDLQWIFMEDTDEVTCFLEYAADIYNHDTMTRMTDAFQQLFKACLADQAGELEQFPLLPTDAAIGTDLLPEQDHQHAVPPQFGTLHGRFQTRAAKTPDAIALHFEGRQWTYAQLDTWSNAVAAQLFPHLKGTEPAVAVCMPPCPEMVAGILGVLKAGAVHVPIQPDTPEARRLDLLDQAGIVLALTTDAERHWDWGQRPVLTVTPASGEVTVALPHVADDQAAFIIHTSGSTGKPKGVLNTHRALLHRLAWLDTHYPRNPDEAHVLYASSQVNESLMEIFQALHYGGALHIAPEDVRKDPAALVRFLADHRIQRLQIVPSLLRLLLTRPDLPEVLAALRLVVVHGEPLPADLARDFRRTLPRCTLVHNYGLSEATGVAALPVGETAALPGNVPFGHSLGGTCPLLLDGRLNPLPVGAVGELYLESDVMARCYVGRPDLTAERFIPHPRKPGARLYRTGDRARYDTVTGYALLGRSDRQIKIRGNRVEPNEVEKVLHLHPDIEDAVVTVHGEALIGYLQTAASHQPDNETLRLHVLRHLPEFMVPAAYIHMAQLPKTDSGKINRPALPDPASATAANDGVRVAPRNALEETLVTIWAKTLGHADVGIDDDFYTLGGHSLKAAQITALFHREQGRELPLNLLLQARTIRRLAELLDRLDDWYDLNSGQGPVLLNQAGETKLFALPPMLGFAVMYRPLAERLTDISLYGFDFLDLPDPATAYADLIQKAQPEGDLILMGYSAGGNLAFETTKVLESRGRHITRLILVDSFFRTGPLKSEQDLLEERAAFLADLETQLRNDPVMGAFADEPYLRGLVRKTPGAFFHHHHAHLDRGTVAAPVDYIRAGEPDPDREPGRAAWRRHTTGGFRISCGTGAHDSMFLDQALTTMTALLTDLLRREPPAPDGTSESAHVVDPAAAHAADEN